MDAADNASAIADAIVVLARSIPRSERVIGRRLTDGTSGLFLPGVAVWLLAHGGTILPQAGCSEGESDDVAQAHRYDVARHSDLMPTGCGALAGLQQLGGANARLICSV
jgi:hypothetical protein